MATAKTLSMFALPTSNERRTSDQPTRLTPRFDCTEDDRSKASRAPTLKKIFRTALSIAAQTICAFCFSQTSPQSPNRHFTILVKSICDPRANPNADLYLRGRSPIW
jgi:hypothetical protein